MRYTYYQRLQIEARVKCVCVQCGKEFTVKPSEAKNGVRKHCSRKCAALTKKKYTGEKCRFWKGGKQEHVCASCGKPFLTRMCPSRIKKGEGKYCSNRCRHKAKSAQMKGKNNLMYDVHLMGEKNPMYGKITHSQGSWFTFPDGTKTWMRSSYEIRVASIFVELNIKWKYEPRVFHLNGTGFTYRPDFLIGETLWWEVKGYLRPDARFRLEKFSELYPTENLMIVGKNDIEQMEIDIHNSVEFDLNTVGITWEDYKNQYLQLEVS